MQVYSDELLDPFTAKFFLRLRLAFGAASAKAYRIFRTLEIRGQIDQEDQDRIDSIKDKQIDEIIRQCEENEIRIIKLTNVDYPDCLLHLPVPPLIIFVKGEVPNFFDLPTVTIVGPRNVSDFGKRAAYSLALRLAKAGFIVVSGAAHGADTFALQGSLDGEGIPVGVLGCGIMYDYLPENRKMREEIAEKGCLISEYTPFERGSKYSFPARNRIMAGLSRTTVVVEAGEKSGALITAKHAVDLGKDVLVIPGNPVLPQYKGSNALLRDGAIPLLDALDVINLYMPLFSDTISLDKAFAPQKGKKFVKNKNKSISGLSKNAAILYNTINKKRFIADDLLISDLTGDEILASLTELEISGFIKSLPGGVFEVL